MKISAPVSCLIVVVVPAIVIFVYMFAHHQLFAVNEQEITTTTTTSTTTAGPTLSIVDVDIGEDTEVHMDSLRKTVDMIHREPEGADHTIVSVLAPHPMAVGKEPMDHQEESEDVFEEEVEEEIVVKKKKSTKATAAPDNQ